MLDKQNINWTKENLRSLRLRLGWSKSELAHHLHCCTQEVEAWEAGNNPLSLDLISNLEMISKQAEACCDEVHNMPVAENQCNENTLSQIDFNLIKENLD